ncbi:NmrA domain-containing protein [Mycena venus]|uniref:NmrA domain-containing protein n=1 Tax=Mycena venus TaxID=2733690 RepID=A0A8H6Y5P1_9AGAR|nr:NmrA domain-containing protein [Mycena venus]
MSKTRLELALTKVSASTLAMLLEREAFIEGTGIPDYGPMLSDIFEAIGTYGCKFSAVVATASESLLSRKPRSWEEALLVLSLPPTNRTEFGGLTRDASKPAAQAFAAQGVQIVSVSLTVDNVANVQKAFEGADIAFSEVTEYAKNSGVPLSVVESAYYATNIFEMPYAFKKQPDGSYVFGLPIPASAQVPLIDVAHDYGIYVRAAIEHPALGPGSEVLSGTMISFGDIIAKLSEVSGKKITYLELKREAFIEATGMPGWGPMLSDMFEAYGACGYYGGKKITNESLLSRKPRSWSDFLDATPVPNFLK